MVQEALKAADILANRGCQVMVIDMAAIKPLDEDLVVAAARKTGFVVTAEEHSVIGGLGGAVAKPCRAAVRRARLTSASRIVSVNPARPETS